MPSRPLPNLLLESFFDLGEDGWKDANDLNMLKLSVLVQAGCESKVAVEPGAPAAGTIIVLDETHATHPNAIAVFDDGEWVYFTPSEGWLIYDRATNQYLTYDTVSWSPLATGGGGGGEILPTPVTGQAASYVAAIGDANSYIRMNVAGANTFTVPPNAAVAFPVGTRLYVEQRGAGVTTITSGAGVTIRSRGAVYNTAGQYAVVALIKVDVDTWVLSGDLA